MFDTLHLVENGAKDVQITFTDYFYRRLALELVLGVKDITTPGYDVQLDSDAISLANEYLGGDATGGDLTYNSGLFRDDSAAAGNLEWEYYADSYTRTPIKEAASADYTGLNNLFYKAVYGVFAPNASASTYYQNQSGTNLYYNAVASLYEAWYDWDGTKLTLYYPPTWHTNPIIDVGTTPPTEADLITSYGVLNAVPYGNIVVDATNINMSLAIDSSLTGANAINLTLELNVSTSDIIDTDTELTWQNQTFLTSMAVVDIFGQPLVLATFPLKMLSPAFDLKDEYVLSFGVPYLQPTA